MNHQRLLADSHDGCAARSRYNKSRAAAHRSSLGIAERFARHLAVLRGFVRKAVEGSRTYNLFLEDHGFATPAPLAGPREHWCRRNRMNSLPPAGGRCRLTTDSGWSGRGAGVHRKVYADSAPESVG